MKFFSAFMVFLAVAPAFCQTTAIDIIPKLKADCLKADYPLLNQVSEVTKLQEDGDTVSFSFDTAIGSCTNQQLTPYAIAPEATIEILRSKIVLFQKESVTSSMVHVSPTLARVTMTFDKNRVFKNANVAKFDMALYPTGRPPMISRTDAFGRTSWYQAPYIYFGWKVILTQIDDDHCAMQVELTQH